MRFLSVLAMCWVFAALDSSAALGQLWYETRNLPGVTWVSRTLTEATVVIARGTLGTYANDPDKANDPDMPINDRVGCSGCGSGTGNLCPAGKSPTPAVDYDASWVLRAVENTSRGQFSAGASETGIKFCIAPHSRTAITIHEKVAPGEYEQAIRWGKAGKLLIIKVIILDSAGPLAPEISIAADQAEVKEGETLSFTVTADAAQTANLSLKLLIEEQGGFVASSEIGDKTLTLLSGKTSAPHSVSTTALPASAHSGSVTATLQDHSPPYAWTAAVPPGNQATVAVLDDSPPPEITITGGSSVTEGAAASFTVSASPAPTANLPVSLTVSENTAGGRDFVASGNEGSKTVTIPASMTSATYDVPTVDDNMDEPNGSVTVAVNPGTGYTVGTNSSASVTVNDNDATPPTVSFASAASSAAEDAGSVNVAVNLSPAPTSGITVSYTVGGTATSGTDFAALSGSVSAASGATSVNIPVAITDDASDESDETVILTLTTGSGYSVGSTSEHTLTITDNDSGGGTPAPPANPVVSFASASSSAAEDADTANVAVNLSPAPTSGITVSYTVGGTATPGADFAALSGMVSVASGATSVNIPVAITDDASDESDETVILTLTAGSGYTVGSTRSHTLTITDNDDSGVGTPAPPANPVVSFASASSIATEDAGSVDVMVNLNPASTSKITVNYTTGGTATSGTDFAALLGLVQARSNATSVNIPVAIIDDRTAEDDETVALTLTAGSGYAVGSTSSHTLTITDNDDNIATSAEGDEGAEIPEAFALRQNYPNPFNPSTTIEFSLNKAQCVSLAVYDVLGHKVRTLMEGVQPAANYRVSFDASDLPSGAYLYALRTDEQTAVKKMSLLR